MIADTVKKWVQKAENDLKIGRDELLTDDPATDLVCFHFQQFVEKYLKAFLIFHQKYFRKTHNIAELIELCKEIDQDFGKLYAMEVDTLTIYATQVRYPEDFYMPDVAEANRCLEIANKLKTFVRARLENSGVFDL